jgi:hypothetical protein
MIMLLDHTPRVQGLIRFAPIWPEYIREFLVTSIDDGISYAEVRINFLFKYDFHPSPTFESPNTITGICLAQMGRKMSLIVNGSECLVRS